MHNIRVWYKIRLQPAIERICRSFGDIAKVGYKACPTKEAWEQVPMYPLIPLGISSGVWFFVLWLEHPDNLPVTIPCKIATGAAL